MTTREKKQGGIIISLVLIALIAVGFTLLPSNDTTASAKNEQAPSTTVDDACKDKYVQEQSKNEENRVIDDFSARYAQAAADSDNQSDAQRDLLIEESAKNAQVLAIWSHTFGLYEDPNKWDQLVKDGCLSEEGVTLHNQFEGMLSAKGTTFKEAEAPANGHNSGVNDGQYGVANDQGIYGDRKAIMVTLKDGSVAYIMVRCGNPVFPSPPPGIPDVPTDNPPPPENPPENPPVCPPDMPHGTPPLCKDSPSRDPYSQGNAPTGGGPNADRGPGLYIPPNEMEKPGSQPRPNPPAPKPAPGSGNGGGSKPKPEPTFDHPDPEPAAPKPSDPETGCTPIPGVESC